ncbi:MAG: hypothetical protein RIS69_1903 [Actinomycetota bacterium]
MKVMTQQWQDLLFAHWAYEPDVVQRLLPSGVELDTFEGKAYVGLVPFNMRNLRLRGLPPIPTTSNFGEVNPEADRRCGFSRSIRKNFFPLWWRAPHSNFRIATARQA